MTINVRKDTEGKWSFPDTAEGRKLRAEYETLMASRRPPNIKGADWLYAEHLERLYADAPLSPEGFGELLLFVNDFSHDMYSKVRVLQ